MTAMAADVEPQGLHDFDFLIGEMKTHHRRLKERLAGSTEWIEYSGTLSARKILGGYGNMDDNFIEMPGGSYWGATFRAFDAKTGEWRIWWLDSRYPANPVDPPMKGRFENGVGLFLADDTFNGRPIKVRFIWSRITARSARWEQAFSADGGKTWETNWITDFERVS